MTLRVLDLFSGIGAYALGVERAGMKVVAFCECEEFPRKVLRKHWPDVPIYEDVRTLTADTLRRDGIAVDVIVGGWPCQDISPAGQGGGLDGERSGLWSEVRRLLGEIPRAIAILENSANLLSLDGGRWFSQILRDLAALGRNAEWHCLPAAAFDAPHIRDRVWIIVNAADAAQQCRHDGAAKKPGGRRSLRRPQEPVGGFRSDVVAYANSVAPVGTAIARYERHTWASEPRVDRVAYGIADHMDRIHALGNCNPPIIPETIARAILATMSLKAEHDGGRSDGDTA